MPRMDGLEATRIIRKEVPQLQGHHHQPERSRHRPLARLGTDRRGSLRCQKRALARIDLRDRENRLALRKMDRAPIPMPRRRLSTPGWLAGSGTLGRLIRDHDWSRTPLGLDRKLAAKSEDVGQSDSQFAPSDVDRLGHGNHLSLQRRLHRGVEFGKASLGAGQASR